MAAPHSIIERHIAHLQGWIQDCNENHGDNCHAGPIAGRPQHHIPDWVIDTEDGCIIPGHSVQRYVALSYVWGPVEDDEVEGQASAEDRLMLQKDNLAEFCRHGFLHSGILERVPIVIQDAINFVKLSGSRYLWVDSLCIVQHDDTTMDRVGLMNEIYSGAYFTVIAAASTRGLYGNNHHDVRNLPREFASLRSLHSKLLGSHWASRGWTFQEQLLSKRSMIFLDGVCFWDCQHDVQWPYSTADGDTTGSFAGFNATFQVQRQPSIHRHPFESRIYRRTSDTVFTRQSEYYDLNSPSPVPDFRFYIELVCRYSNRNLTYDQDVLSAFSGVLEALSRRSFLGGFICGLPALFFDSALLWQPLLRARRRSPVRTATNIAPMAPLPSWSWAGWQCLINPDSLRGGLDYIQDYLGRGSSWATWKLVDWSTLSDDRSVNSIDEPALLQSFKDSWGEPISNPLPTGWCRLPDSHGFVHASKDDDSYEYPLPTQNSCSATIADRNASLLSCTTQKALLRVRRVLVPYDVEKPKCIRKARACAISVFETELYNFKPKVQDLSPIVTLEDDKGQWAGVMTIMDDRATVHTGSELEMIAISTGGAFYTDLYEIYPERIDGPGFWQFERNSDEYYFRPLDWQDEPDNSGGIGKFSAKDDTRQSINADIDVGPFARVGLGIGTEVSEYYFYNVLWVENIDGVMYRKAAGRVPKEIWERNCGETTQILLG